MFDDTTMNIFRNKAENQHMKVVDGYFTKTEDNNLFIYIGSLQDIYWKNDTHEIIDVLRPHYKVKKTRQYIYIIY